MLAPLRIAFDMDGTLADLSSAYAELEERLFGVADAEHEQPAPEVREVEQHEESAAKPPVEAKGGPPRGRHQGAHAATSGRDRVWQTIEATPDFWTTLKPLEQGAVERLYELTGKHNWEVFFVTQRPATAGRTVQWQTHVARRARFKTPSVIPLSGARGKLASALNLDYLVDDTPQNCVDVLSDSATRTILLINRDDPLAETSARRLGIGVARCVHDVLDVLVQATAARANPTLFDKLRRLVGWK